MKYTRLRYLAEVNPATPSFERLPPESAVTFLPLEAVWADQRMDTSRRRQKREVANGYVRFQVGDVLFPKVTPSFQAGRAAHVQSLQTKVGAASTEVHVLRARPGTDARYLRYLVQTQRFLSQGVSAFQGVAGLQRVPEIFVRDFSVLDLPLDEQRRVADFLDGQVTLLDRAIELRQQQRALDEERLTAHLRELLTRESNGAWLPLRRFDARVTTGPFGTVFAAAEYVVGGVPMVNPTHIKDGMLRPEAHESVAPETAARLARYALRAGDLVVSRKGDIGRSALVGEESDGWICGSDSIAIRTAGSRLAPLYVWLLMRLPEVRDQLLAGSLAATMPSLNEGNLLGLRVPNLAEARQSELASEGQKSLERTRTLAAHLSSSISLLQERKQALISAAVAGILDVSTAGRTAQ